MANEKNLIPFKKGYDERREGNGRPKGRKSLATIIREFEDEEFDWSLFPKSNEAVQEVLKDLIPMGSPWRAVIYKAFLDAIGGKGMERAAAREFLRKAGYGDKLDLDVTSKGESIAPKIVSEIKPNVTTQTETAPSNSADQ